MGHISAQWDIIISLVYLLAPLCLEEFIFILILIIFQKFGQNLGIF
jgi:hypothetical protein